MAKEADSKKKGPAKRPTVPKVNLTRIAKESGVNLSTVSRILRGEAGYTFAAETRAKVMAVAEKYRYRSNLLVRGLVTGQTLTVGVVIPAGGFYSEVIKGIHDRLLEANRGMLLAWNEGNHGAEAIATETKLLSNLVERRVDGIILRPVHDDAREAYFREVLDRNIPLVTVDRRLSGMDVDFSGTDDERAGQLAAEYLVSLGHRHGLVVNFSTRIEPARLRQKGFLKAAESLGMKVTCLEDLTGEDLRSAIRRHLLPGSKITAVFATTTTYVRMVLSLCREMGRRCPEDLSLVGMMEEPLAQDMTPAITTVRQSPLAIGRQAAEMLLSRMEGTAPPAPRIHREPVELVVRESTAVLKSRS